MEEWKDVVGYEGYYQVSSHGRVRSLDHKAINRYGGMIKGRILKPYICAGYQAVGLHANNVREHKLIHRLVAEAFVLNQDDKPVVNHIDENKFNNFVNNLEWVTCRENINHGTCISRMINHTDFKARAINIDYKAIVAKTDYKARNAKINFSAIAEKKKVKIVQYTLDGVWVKVWDSLSEAAKSVGKPHGNIVHCCKRKYKFAYGYIWRYANGDLC